MSGKNTYTPALFVHIQTDVNRLTRKIKFATINHGKPPFGENFVGNKIIAESKRLAFLFMSVARKGRDSSLRELSAGRIESGEILAQRPSGGAGRAEGKISELSYHPVVNSW
jgi:hypothetical protein